MTKKLLFRFLIKFGLQRLIINYMKFVAITGRGSDKCLKEGFLPVPVHFYSPIPDINDLVERKIWDHKSDLPGINFNKDGQLVLLRQLANKYANECHWPLTCPPDDHASFFLDNQSFSFGCAASTHLLVRHYKPSTVIEIGSGMSTRVIASALMINNTENMLPNKHIVIDPYPLQTIELGQLGPISLTKSRVELIEKSFFQVLKENDILFIDSSHSVKIGSDVNYLFLEIIPRLAPGVIVHIHDISLPYEYPSAYARNENFRQFWTEQYLLQSFLCFNSEFEVLLAMEYLMRDHIDDFKNAFPQYDPAIHKFLSGSFWMRRLPVRSEI